MDLGKKTDVIDVAKGDGGAKPCETTAHNENIMIEHKIMIRPGTCKSKRRKSMQRPY